MRFTEIDIHSVCEEEIEAYATCYGDAVMAEPPEDIERHGRGAVLRVRRRWGRIRWKCTWLRRGTYGKCDCLRHSRGNVGERLDGDVTNRHVHLEKFRRSK